MFEIVRANRVRLRQFGTLTTANVVSLVVNLVTVTLMTHWVTVVDFGAYRYAIAFLNGAAVLCQLGIPYSASLRLTRMQPEDARRLILTVSVAMFVLSLGAGLLGALAFSAVASTGVPWAQPLALAAPVSFTLVMQVAYINLLNGANAINALALQVALPPTLILAGLVVAHHATEGGLSLPTLLTIFVAAYAVVHLVTIASFWASLRGVIKHELALLKPIWLSAGWRVYVGTLFAAATTNALNLILGALVGLDQYALFAMAYSMAVPVQMIPSTVGIILFKHSAQSSRLSRKTISVTVGLTLAGLVSYLAFLWVLFPVVFPSHFLGARTYASFLVLTTALLGLGDFFNRFIGAHARAQYLMVGALVAGVVNIVATISLALRFGVAGAIAGMCLASLVYLGCMVAFYRRLVRSHVGMFPGGQPAA